MRILASAAETTPDHKIKMKNKNDEILITASSRIHEIFNDKSHVTSSLPDEISIDSNPVFSPTNMIIIRKTIFVLNAVFQIIQLEAINSHLILIEYL